MAVKKAKNIRGAWNTVNIKAFTNQVPQHYIDAFEALILKDPLVKLQGNRHISIEGYDYVGNKNYPSIIVLRLCAYDIMDPEAFYNIREKKQVFVDISPDIVSNKKSAELFFVPDVHRFMMLQSSKISTKQVARYFNEGFMAAGHGGEFDVNIEVSQELIETIEKSYQIHSLEATLSYSNHDHSSDGFVKFFDNKSNEAKADKMFIRLVAGIGESLRFVKDGLVEAVLHLVKSNGTAKARIRKEEGDSLITVNTNEHPEIVHLQGSQDEVENAVRNHLLNAYGQKDN
ncbi:MAG: DUF4747 family protein [Prevotella sp.]|nr:DUF4747 family protein [Prevotella sp.]